MLTLKARVRLLNWTHKRSFSTRPNVTVVTGGSRGIGFSIAQHLAQKGHSVAVVSKTQKCFESSNKINNLLQRSCTQAYQCDVSNSSNVESTIKSIERDFGAIDTLINCAGVSKDALLLYLKDQDLADMFSTNVFGSIYMSRSVCKAMMKQKYGNIIMMGSVVGQQGNIGQVGYSASKAALLGAVKSMAKELGPKGVRTNLVSLGYFETDMTEGVDIKKKEDILKQIPLGRFGKFEDVHSTIDFILANEYINGQDISINGGLNF